MPFPHPRLFLKFLMLVAVVHFICWSSVQDNDRSVYAVSAWNDNGFRGIAANPYSLRRTSYFPGLGWLLTRQLYKGHVREY